MEGRAEASKDLLIKDKKKCIIRQTKTKSIPTEQHQHLMTRQQTRRQTRGRNGEATNDRTELSQVADRHRVAIPPRESRYLRVTAVNHRKSEKDKDLKSTTNWGHRAGPTACTHPTTNTTSSTAAAAGKVTRKTRTSIPPPAVCQGRQRVKKNVASSSQRSSSSKLTAITVPDVVAEAVPCPRAQLGSKVSSLSLVDSASAVIVKVEKPPQLQRTNVHDPDIGTESDPYLCGEYVKDIYQYLLELEARPVYAVRENFLSNQMEVRKHHRNILVDWLVQVHRRFLLVPETLYLTIDILDRSLQVSSGGH